MLSPRQTSTANQAPIAASSDVWATVIANVAPIMTLVGERNAKEFLRVSSSHDQLVLMATAPLGILSLMICAIRLSGPPILRRLTGREADSKTEALVELTPLSVAPATSVYTQHAVEIKPSEQRDEAAFVCAHIKQTHHVRDALASFKHLLDSRVQKAKDYGGKANADREDYEIVLGMKGSTLTAKQTADLIESIINGKEGFKESLAKSVKSTSLSFRVTGISPTQTVATDQSVSSRRVISKLPSLGNVLAAICSFIAMGGVQIAGYYKCGAQIGKFGLQTLLMGLVGYCGITIFTFIMLVTIKQEIDIEPQDLHPIFDNEDVVWTFADSRHAQHRAFEKPPQRNLVQAAPKKQQSSKGRQVITCFISAGLIGSYVVYYLGIRVAVWWVAFGDLMITWVSAVFRAWVIRVFLKANDEELGEHWLGIFRDDLSASLLETVATMERKEINSFASSKNNEVKRVSEPLPENPAPSSSRTVFGSDIEMISMCSETSIRPTVESCTLVVAKPIRQSLQNWSGCEDIMKVALEMAKHICESHHFNTAGHQLDFPDVSRFKRVIRFRLMIYVPGILWKANSDLDYILTEDFDIPNLYRDILKIFHLCSEMKGIITRHETLTGKIEAEVSNVLCGPLKFIPDSTIPDGDTITLTTLLVELRNQNTVDTKAYTLDQSVLLPTIQLATMYETHCDDQELFSRIQQMQNLHTDRLRLSGEKCLPTLEAIFEKQNIWQHFMTLNIPDTPPRTLQPRNSKSGLYGGQPRKLSSQVEKRKERSFLQKLALRIRPGKPGQWNELGG